MGGQNLCDDSKAVGAASLEREESKEEEYDYFLDAQADENQGNAQGYHVLDEDGQTEDDEDLEELDDEERAERYREMLKDLRDD